MLAKLTFSNKHRPISDEGANEAGDCGGGGGKDPHLYWIFS